MLKIVILAENALDAQTWEKFETEDLCAFLKEHFGTWPATARVYHTQVSEANDVTPSDEAGIIRLASLEGVFYVVVYPGDPLTIVVAVVAVAAAAAAAFLLMPEIPGVSNRSQQQASPNNELSNRSNKPRPNSRIPDIFGTVYSVPDLIALPYKIFESNIEVEYSYMCIGKGTYDVSEISDDTTLISTIAGSKVEVYSPFTSPNYAPSGPQINIGGAIATKVLNVSRSNAVNGQLVRAPNSNIIKGDSNIRAVYPNALQANPTSGINFAEAFKVGDSMQLLGGTFGSYVLTGTYTIIAVTELQITITATGPWLDPSFVGVTTVYASPFLTVIGDYWVGPFILDDPNANFIYCNFVASNGMYKDDGTNQYPVLADVQIEVTPVNALGVPTGGPVYFAITMKGSSANRDARNSTMKADLPFVGRASVRARRLTGTDLVFVGQVSDEIKWRDLYSVSPVVQNDFGNVTTVQSVTVATAGALQVKDRKLNMQVTRKIPLRISGSTFTSTLYATNRSDEILSFVMLDQKIGNRNIAEIDFDNIYNTVTEVEEYFGTDLAVGFNYTFDDTNISFEETVSAIVGALFSVAYRRGSIIRISFEKLTEDSTLLFNHRNKLPGSETRSVRFGNQDDLDGVEFEYTSPDDGGKITIYLPADQSAVNPKSIKSVGITSGLKAYFHAWRAWNKIRYQNISVEFEATGEADLTIIRDRILVTDNTRSQSLDGNVESQNGLELELSQSIDLGEDDYTIFLQHVDGSVEALPVTQGFDPYHVVLAAPPRATLALDDDLYVKTTFSIVGTTGLRTKPFLVTEKSPQSNFIISLSAINYEDRYYNNDFDFIDGIVDENGN